MAGCEDTLGVKPESDTIRAGEDRSDRRMGRPEKEPHAAACIDSLGPTATHWPCELRSSMGHGPAQPTGVEAESGGRRRDTNQDGIGFGYAPDRLIIGVAGLREHRDLRRGHDAACRQVPAGDG